MANIIFFSLQYYYIKNYIKPLISFPCLFIASHLKFQTQQWARLRSVSRGSSSAMTLTSSSSTKTSQSWSGTWSTRTPPPCLLCSRSHPKTTRMMLARTPFFAALRYFEHKKAHLNKYFNFYTNISITTIKMIFLLFAIIADKRKKTL